MAIATTPNQRRDWFKQAERDLPADKRTAFELRGVPFAVRSQFGVLLGLSRRGEDSTDALAGIPAQEIARLYVLAIRTCLIGWRNYRDAEGNDVKFVGEPMEVCGTTLRGVATDETLERLDTETIAELGAECLANMVLNKADVLG